MREYLSDEELAELIVTVEENDPVVAPGDLLENVLCRIADGELRSGKIEFGKYCFQIITSAAAAIIVMLTVPDLMGSRELELSDKQTFVASHYQSKEDRLEKNRRGLADKIDISDMIDQVFYQNKKD